MPNIKITDHSRLRFLQRVKRIKLNDNDIVPKQIEDIVQKMNGTVKVLFNHNCYVFENYTLVTIISRISIKEKTAIEL